MSSWVLDLLQVDKQSAYLASIHPGCSSVAFGGPNPQLESTSLFSPVGLLFLSILHCCECSAEVCWVETQREYSLSIFPEQVC
jgi:hypothetical protein